VHSQLIGRRGLHFGFPAVGLSELFAPQAARAIERNGGRVLLGTLAEKKPGGVMLQDGTRLAADYVVEAVAPRELEPSPYISSYLWFDRKLGTERFWALLGAQKRLNTDFYDLSNIRQGWGARPSLIASNIIYSHRAAGMSDAQIVAATLREIAEYLPEAAQARVVHAVVNRIPMAIPCPLPGSESARPAPSVSLAGDWTRTGLPCSMESAVRSGFMAAEEVLRAVGRPKRVAIEPPAPEGIAGLINRISSFAKRRRAARGRAWRTPPTARPGAHL
jgi:15-cis-phytoene desaturase